MDPVDVSKFILASASPRRKYLLERLGASFEVLPAEVEEFEEGHGDPEGMVRYNALLKASWVADLHPDRYVLGSDTTVHIDGRVLAKPVDLQDARRMLHLLSGRTHVVYTALALVCRSRKLQNLSGARSEVTFKDLDDDSIGHYFQQVNPLDKAGAYGIQEGAEIVISGYSGSHSNIMGLPLEETKRLLARHKLL